jgi:hypothetical protein
MSQILFSGPVDQRAELMKLFRISLDQLLDLAITHELGHAFCREFDEGKATVYGEQLRAGQTPTCESPGPHHEMRATNQASFTTLSTSEALTLQGQKNAIGPEPSPPPKPGIALQ